MNGFRRWRLGACSTAGTALLVVVAGARAGVIAPDLLTAMEAGGDVPFIARFAERAAADTLPGKGQGRRAALESLIVGLRSTADASQQLARDLLQRQGAKRIVQLWSINALAGTASPEAIEALAALPGIESIGPDATLASPAPQPAATAVPEWNLDAVGAPVLWGEGLTGVGVVVAGMDTGVDGLHPDLATRWRGDSNSWFDPNGEHATPADGNGHGTQTMGVMVGGASGGTAIGVAPDARWIAVKIFNDAGYATLSGIHTGFQWLLDPDGNPSTDDVPDVVNASWGFPDLVGQCYLEFEADLEILKSAGIAVVFSAGNQGTAGSVSPANNPAGFAVGAVDAALAVAATSSRGPSACDGSVYPEVVAPGVGIRTSDLTFNGTYPNSYAAVSGTSFAAPHVAGAMALLRQADPAATVAELEQAVTASAADVGPSGPDNTSGYGMLDAPAARQWLATAPPPCVDTDGDGFYGQVNCGTAVDCNDASPAINPAACDIVGDGIDQNCDGVDRLKGKACPVSGGGSGGGKGKPR